jgi:purine-binding chemotaxis protein CheW
MDINAAAQQGLFAIRGNLDGDLEEEYSLREQFIGLMIGNEEFYLEISVVNEIVMLQPITFVPQAHKYIEGVINLRGTIMPAINVRKMMGLPRGQVTPSTRVIIAQHKETLFGILVDGITYVMSLLPSELEDQSLSGRSAGADLISRISKSRDRVVGVLDLGKILYQIVDEEKLDQANEKAAE